MYVVLLVERIDNIVSIYDYDVSKRKRPRFRNIFHCFILVYLIHVSKIVLKTNNFKYLWNFKNRFSRYWLSTVCNLEVIAFLLKDQSFAWRTASRQHYTAQIPLKSFESLAVERPTSRMLVNNGANFSRRK